MDAKIWRKRDGLIEIEDCERKKDQADDNSKQKSLTIVEMEEHTEKHLQRIKKHILK